MCDRVADFIGKDTIILGHNVLFDISMLASHGIDLSAHPILDTFELAEIFSQNAESLNLGFLGDFYGIQKRGEEHRALTDTWIAVDLFLHYLRHISKLSGIQKILWKRALTASSLSLLAPFFDTSLSGTDIEQWNEWTSSLQTTTGVSQDTTDIPPSEVPFFLVSLENDRHSEVDLIRATLAEHGNIRIIARNKKSAENLLALLKEHHLDAVIAHEYFEFITASEVITALESLNTASERKQSIFLIKMAFWLTETRTGLISELKYYGNEFSLLESFRLHSSESNTFLRTHRSTLEGAAITLARYTPQIRASKTFSLFKDISLCEETIRKAHIHTIRFEALIENIHSLRAPSSPELIACLRTLEAMYVNIPDRGTGENPIPPGKYGETYFFTQESLWQ